MKKRNTTLLTLGLVICLTAIIPVSSSAATTFLSKGRLELNNNTPDDPTDDVIFDIDDLKTLDTKVEALTTNLTQLETDLGDGKQDIVDELNKNPNIDITDPDPSLPDIVQYIKQMSNIPADTYFYESGTEGSTAIVRYKKINGKYYKCDANGTVAPGAPEVNVGGKTLKDYAATTAGNLSAGAAGYANGGFYLGDGSDNAAYQNQASTGTAVVGDVLAGKTFNSAAGKNLTGTMVNRGTLNWNPTSNTTQTVQPGYYSGGTLNSAGAYNKGKTDGATQSKVGTAAAGDVLAGKTFTNSTGVGLTGTMVNRGQLNWNPTSSETFIVQPGYYSGGTLSTEAVYKKGLEESIKGDWSLKLSFHIMAGNSSSLLSGSYVRVTLKKGIFETVLYEKDVTTFISTETVTKNLIDYSGYFNSSHKIRIELAFAGHNSGTFMGNVYAKLYFINSNGETLLHTVTTTSTTHDEHKEILIGQYIK